MDTLAIDWDGTCVENKWPAFGDWNPGAVDALHELSKHYRIIIHTARIAPFHVDGMTRRTMGEVAYEIGMIRQKLDEAGLHFVTIHQDPWKPGAVAYIDDRAVKYTRRKGSWKAITVRMKALATGVVDE